jgi:outer membrane protein
MILKRVQGIALLLTLALNASGAHAGDRVYTLEDAYNSALGTNENIKIAEESVSQSGNIVDQAWTYLYPRLIGRAAYTRFNETLPPEGGLFLFQPLEQYQAALVLTQPLYTGGRTLAALSTAKKMQEASQEGLSVAKQDILFRVSEAYYGVLKAQKSVEISRHSLERMEHHKLVTEREASTRKTKANASALLRANTLVSQARINLVRAQDGLKIAREKLGLLTRLPMDALITEPPPLDQPMENIESLKASALQNRDDYAVSKMNVSIASENVTIVRGGHYPQLYAEAGIQYQDSRPAIFTDATAYYGGLRLQIPIFEGGLMKAEVSEARSKARQAELASVFLRMSIESEVHEAYVNLQTITSVLETAKLQMGYAKDNFDVVEGLFAEGLMPSLSLIDAEQALNMAERELMNATYDRQVAILKLKKSIGMLGKNIEKS